MIELDQCLCLHHLFLFSLSLFFASPHPQLASLLHFTSFLYLHAKLLDDLSPNTQSRPQTKTKATRATGMSSTVTSRFKDIITFVLPRCVTECVPLLLATALFQLELVRFCFFQGVLRPTGPQQSLDWVASCLPWNVPQDPHSWLGRLTLWGCSIVCTASTVALDVVLIIRGNDKDVRSRPSLQQTYQTEPRDKAGESVECHNQFLHDGDGASNISTEREVETTNRPLQGSQLGLNSDRKTEKAVRFFPSSADVVVMASVDGEDHSRMVCEHKVEERPGNPEPSWSLAPSLMANSNLSTERAATTKSFSPFHSSSAIVPAGGPSFAEVAGSRGHSLTELDQEHTSTAGNINHDKTFAQAVVSSDAVESLQPASKDRGQSVPTRSQAAEVTMDSKTFAQAAAEGIIDAKGDDLDNGEATEESADGPSVIDPKVSVSFAAAAAGDQDKKIETRGEKERSGVDSSVKTFAEAAAVVAPTMATEESFESDPETTTTTATLVPEDSDRLHCDTSSPWSPASILVEPPSPGSSAKGHESDDDHHSEQSDDTSDSSDRKNKNRGLKKTNRKNKNKKRRERSKMGKVATRCQLNPSTTSIGTASMTAEADKGEKAMEEKMRVAAAPSLPLTVAEQSNGGVRRSYSTAAANVATGHDLDAGKKTGKKAETKGEQRQQKFVTPAENGDMIVTTD